MYQTDDIEKQHELLNRVSKLIDDGTLISTVTTISGRLVQKRLKLPIRSKRAAVSSGRMCSKAFNKPE